MGHDRVDGSGGRGIGRRVTVAAIPAAVVVFVLTLVAAGCGGSSSDNSANEAYASSVCTAIGSWEKQIKSIATDFSGGISKASLQSKVSQAEAATKQLATQIKAVPPPKSSQGQAAKQQLDQLSTDVTTTVSAAKSAIAQIQGDASVETVTGAVAMLAPQVQNLASETKAAVSTLKGAGGSLASAFKSADSCQSLG